MWLKSNRYFNTKKVTNQLGRWDSKFEAAYAQELDLRVKAKDIAGYDAHLRIPLEVNGYVVCDYYIDFAIYHHDGTTEYVETKGKAEPVWRLKWKLFCALYEDKPDVKISLVMQGKQYNPRMRRAR